MRSCNLGYVVLLGVAVWLAPATAQAQFMYSPGFGGPWGGGTWGGGGLPGISNSYYSASWSYPYPVYPNGFSSGPILFPGFVAVEQPRSRRALYPAIPLPPHDVIVAAIYGEEADQGRAIIEVTVPREDAQVSIDGTLMKQTGMLRTFKTPPLDPKTSYSMTVRITWNAGGVPQTVTRVLNLRSGDRERIDLRSLGNN